MDDSIYDACPIKSQLTDIGDRLQHTWISCNICSKLKEKAEKLQKNKEDGKAKNKDKVEEDGKKSEVSQPSTPSTPKTPGPGPLSTKPSPFGSGSLLNKRKSDGKEVSFKLI